MSVTDKRSVHTDALDVLGTIITGKGMGRDAIHLAVEPAVAAHTLSPGCDVGRYEDGRYGQVGKVKYVGIVDPFLKFLVKENEEFLLVVYPRTITSLRHVWSHPDFPEQRPEDRGQESAKTKDEESPADAIRIDSERWMKQWCEEVGIRYEKLMMLADAYQSHGARPATDGWTMALPPAFWSHWSAIKGRPINRGGSFWEAST